MTPEQLKASILQYAIQGKLVEQRPEEGTAEELYQQIQEEKKKLIKEGKIKKEKPLSDITEDEIPFDIPTNWKWVRLKSIISVYGGKRIPAGKKLTKEDTGHIYIRVSDMKNGTISEDDLHYVPNDVYPSIKNYTISKEDIYITVAGTIGRIGIVPEIFDGANLTENADKLVIYSLNKFYILYLLESTIIQSQIQEATTKVGQPKLAIKRIEDLLIPLPPLKEQHRMVDKIERMLPYVNRYAASYAKLEQFNANFPEEMKKSILQYAIQGKLVEQRPEEGTAEELYQQIQEEKQKLIKEGKIKKEKPLPNITEDEIPFDIPDSWKWVCLSSLCKSITDGDHQPPPQSAEGYPFVVISNVSSGYLNLSNTRHVGQEYFNSLSPDRIAEKGDLLFTVTGSYGIVIDVDVEEKFCFQRHIALIKPIACKEFLSYILKSPYIKSVCDELSTGIAQKTVGLNTLRNMLIPLPPLEEQRRIIYKLEELMQYCDKLVK